MVVFGVAGNTTGHMLRMTPVDRAREPGGVYGHLLPGRRASRRQPGDGTVTGQRPE
jgi:hypothetical protein